MQDSAWSRSALSLTNAAKQGALNVEGGLRKNWKKRWVILHGEYLYIYSDDGAEKPKDVLVLSDLTDVSPVESKELEFKVKLKSTNNKWYYFQATKIGEREAWISTLREKITAASDITQKYGYGGARIETAIYIKIGEVRLSDQEPRDTYCTILVDSLPIGRTPAFFETNNPIFNSEHEFDLKPDAQAIVIQLKDHAIHRKRKDGVIGVVVIPVNDLSDQKVHDSWYKFIPPTDFMIANSNDSVAFSDDISASVGHNDKDGENADIGQVKITIQLQESEILPDKCYNDLFALLVEKDCAITLRLAAVSSKKEKVVAECLVKVFELRRCAVHYIKKITEAEVNTTADPNVIFRANTVCTKSVDMYLRLTGMSYLQHVLKPFVQNLYQKDKRKSCEVDPMRLEESSEAKKEKVIKKNAKTLIGYVSDIFTAIKNSLSICPMNFRNVFEHILKVVSARFQDHPVARFTSISGFIFLRFFCPALLTPKYFDLATEDPPPSVARDLTLIVKAIQNLANMVVFGKKEQFMVVCNEFIESSKEDMKKFLLELSTPPTTPVDELPQKLSALNFGSEMARVHAQLIDSHDDLVREFGTDPQVEKLTGILQMLDKEANKEVKRLRGAARITSPTINGSSGSSTPAGNDDHIEVSESSGLPLAKRTLSNSTPSYPVSGSISLQSVNSPYSSVSTPNTPLQSPVPPPFSSKNSFSNNGRQMITNSQNLNNQNPQTKKSLGGRWEENIQKKQMQQQAENIPESPYPTPLPHLPPQPQDQFSSQSHPQSPPQSQPQHPQVNLRMCPRCHQVFVEKEPVVAALGFKWHVHCFTCHECSAPIKGSFVSKNGIPRCLGCFPTLTHCNACGLLLQGAFVNLNDKAYHEACLKCVSCGKKASQNDTIQPGRFTCSDCRSGEI